MLHLVEVEVAPSGVSMRVDGVVVATSRHVPRWREAYLLIGVQGPGGRKARVHVAGAGFSGPIAQVPLVVEAPVTMASRQVLDLAEEAPDLGIARRPLASAAEARLVATISAPPGLDLSGLVVQLGDERLPARLAAPVRPGHGAVATVIADVPARLLGPRGPASLSPVALRAPTPGRAMVLESYLEVEPRPGATFSRTTPRPATPPGSTPCPKRRSPSVTPPVVPCPRRPRPRAAGWWSRSAWTAAPPSGTAARWRASRGSRSAWTAGSWPRSRPATTPRRRAAPTRSRWACPASRSASTSWRRRSSAPRPTRRR
ncbi:hypothetical protein ACFQV2_24540 [Actinokineospora soli]|uniref:Uncharacterized protein n=1 Tax=Actinokineospora soli TaxID=1048753 RepID=A0ABW2TS47_9PSEU